MADIDTLPGVLELRMRTQGDPRVLIAVLDGQVRTEHPAFAGASIESIRGYWLDPDADCEVWSSGHATFITSVMVGQPGSPVRGLVPECRGLFLATGLDEQTAESELGVARAIEYALAQGATIIHCAFCHPSQTGQAQSWMVDALAKAERMGVVVVAPAGNDYGENWCVPSTVPSVLAVGALADDGAPMHFTNFGELYAGHSIMGPGENVHGADADEVDSGGTKLEKGTSVAAPVLTAIVAALTSALAQQTGVVDPQRVRRVLIETARPCTGEGASRCIGGEVAVDRAMAVLLDGMTVEQARRAFPDGPPAPDAPAALPTPVPARPGLPPHSIAVHHATEPPEHRQEYKREERGGLRHAVPSGASPAEAEPSIRYPSMAFPLGTVHVEFPDERTRQSFAESMGSRAQAGDGSVDDPVALIAYLDTRPAEARRLHWVMRVNGERRYAIRPVGPYAGQVFDMLAALALGKARGEVSVSSVPGWATGDIVVLRDGSHVRELRVNSLRGLYGWQPAQVAAQSLSAVHAHAMDGPSTPRPAGPAVDAGDGAVIGLSESADVQWPRLRERPGPEVEAALADYLQLVSFRSDQEPEVSRERALNFCATNGFQAAMAFADAMADGMEFEDYRLEYSPFARVSGGCWDVVIVFRDPVRGRRALREYRLTVDIGDVMPVSVGRLRRWAGLR